MSAPYDVVAYTFDGMAFCPACAARLWSGAVLAGNVAAVSEYGAEHVAPVFRDMLDGATLTCSGVRPGDAHVIGDVEHVNYPHEPGYLYDCPACESTCHCTPGASECVFTGHGVDA